MDIEEQDKNNNNNNNNYEYVQQSPAKSNHAYLRPSVKSRMSN